MILLTTLPQGAVATEQLPDLTAAVDAGVGAMLDGSYDRTTKPTRTLYRFTAVIPNIGVGPFELREETDANQTQTSYQRVYDAAGDLTAEYTIGTFEDVAPAFGHLHLPGLAQYNLRAVLPDEGDGPGVGPVLATHDKTSFGVVDSTDFDLSLPGAPDTRQYWSANAPILGISVGWLDLYGSSLPGQWIDVTDLEDGTYWLEVVIDPYERVRELNDDNNVVRTLVDLTIPAPTFLAGDFNTNEMVDGADLLLWEENYGLLADATHGQGDANLDESVRGDDFLAWQRDVGASAASVSVVPSPTAWSLGMAGMLLLTAIRKHRQRLISTTYVAVERKS